MKISPLHIGVRHHGLRRIFAVGSYWRSWSGLGVDGLEAFSVFMLACDILAFVFFYSGIRDLVFFLHARTWSV